MPHTVVPVKHPAHRARPRGRALLAALLVAGLATLGVSALASPAAAASSDDTAAEQSAVATEEPAAETPASEPAAPPSEEATAPPTDEPADESAAPPAEEAAAPPAEDASAPPVDEPAAATPPEETAPVEMAAAEVQMLLVPPEPGEVVESVEICHRTDAYRNPYRAIEPSIDSILGSNNGQNGHYEEHQGPIFYPDIPKHTEWGDIIPPFSYLDDEDEVQSFPGYNWDAQGQAIYAADCTFVVPNPTFEYFIDECVDGDLSYFEFELSGLLDTVQYHVDLFAAGGGGIETWTISDIEGSFSGSYYLPPGGYYVEVWVFNDDEEVQDWELVETIDFTMPACPLAVTAMGTACSLGDDGTASVHISGLIPGESYEWYLAGNQYDNLGSIEADSESLDIPFDGLPPGNYEFTIWWSDDPEAAFAQTTFFVEPCQPDISVTVTECPAYGEDGSAVLHLSSLVTGPFGVPEESFVEYDVWVTALGDENGTVYGGVHTVTGDAENGAVVNIDSLAAGASYTAWVHGTWTATGGWGEVKEFELHASVDFTLQPCPAKPVTPAGLAATGTSDPTGPIGAAVLLLGLGGAALVARARREGSLRRGE